MAEEFQSCGIPTAPLEAVVFNDDLQKRPYRAPDHASEVTALSTLLQKLADSPDSILQALVEEMLALFNAESAGISLLTVKDGEERFYWPAIAGEWKGFVGGGTPRNFSPCGDVIDRNCSFLFRDLERRYDYYEVAKPRVEECLLVPFYLEGKPVGTLWIVAHGKARQFDSEDLRQLESIGCFAGSAYRTVNTLKELERKSQRLEATERLLRDQVSDLEATDAQSRIAHEALERASTELTRSNGDLERFAHEAAHDLKSPVGSIVRMSELLQFRLAENKDGDIQACLGFLMTSAHQMIALIDDLLLYAAVGEAGDDIQAVGAEEACRNAVANLNAVIEQSGAEVKCSIEPDAFVCVPMTHLMQVFQNLIENAIHYRKPGEQAIVEVAGRAYGPDEWIFEVKDNGIGIEEAYRERIFEPFKRLHGGELPGSGLGLATCKRIVEAAHGAIGFDSRIGEGSQFFFILPSAGD